MSEMGLDVAGVMLSHILARLPLPEQNRIRAEFNFDGSSQGVARDTEILRAIRLSKKEELKKNQEQNGEVPTRGRKKP